jgi:hypothetical protein
MTKHKLTPNALADATARLALAKLAPLLPPGVEPGDLHDHFASLCHRQDVRLCHSLPLCPIPLWVMALARHLGVFVHEETGCVAGWPRPLPENWGLTVDADTGRIMGWPVDGPALMVGVSA